MRSLKFFIVVFSALLSIGVPSSLVAADDPGVEPAKVSPIAALEPSRVVYRQLEGLYLKSPRGVSVDSKSGDIYVADTMNNLIAVYNKDGLPLFSFGYNKELKEPTKAVSDASGHIYVLNGIPRAVKIFTYRGEYSGDFPLTLKEPKDSPTAISMGPGGNIYIGIGGEDGGRIQVYDSNFRLIREIGKKPDGSSYFRSVQAIAIDTDGTIYAADASATPCIQVYGPDGKCLRGWGAQDAGPHNFSLPAGIAIDGEGRVVVVDSIRHAITVFSQGGTYLGRYGGMGSQPGALTYPTDIATNGQRNIYVVERVGSRLQVLEERLGVTQRKPNPASAQNAIREQFQRQLGEVMKGMK